MTTDQKPVGSPPLKFDADDFKSAGWALLDTIAGAVIASLEMLAQGNQNPDTTQTLILFVVGTVGSKLLRKWISDNRKRWTNLVG
jgi:hypothetical protein